MKYTHLIAIVFLLAALTACTPGTFSWDPAPGAAERAQATINEDWPFDRDEPVVYVPPVEEPVPGDTPIRKPVIPIDPEDPVIVPGPPLLPPGPPITPIDPPVIPGPGDPVDPIDPVDPEDPDANCKVIEMPENPPHEKIVKCPGQPAERIPRP